MDDLRQQLYTKVDSLLTEVFAQTASDKATHLQLEALLIRDSSDSSRQGSGTQRQVLDVIKIDDWRQRVQAPTLWHESGEDPSLQHLPSPISDREIGQDGSINGRNNGIVNSARRKAVGGLRLGDQSASLDIETPSGTSTSTTARQLETDKRHPKRRKADKDRPARLEQSTVDKLVEGIWEQIHRPQSLALGHEGSRVFDAISKRLAGQPLTNRVPVTFAETSKFCHQITSGSRTARALEVVIQAHWMDCYNRRLEALRDERPDLKTYEVKRVILTEACSLFQWTEKELRNRMGIWKGYREIKDAAGWSALIFAGPGIYRFCKYRMGFNHDAILKLQALRNRVEVAADTLQPQWRQLLALVDEPTQIHWRGHPHDWVVSKRKDPVPLQFTYRQRQPDFSFTNIAESVLDEDKWGTHDPRRSQSGPDYVCDVCSRRQSLKPEENECECFPDLFSPNPRQAAPVQIFRTESAKNNGLIACCTFERGAAVGEFVGLITRGLSGVDVMQSQVAEQSEPYQIWQGEVGNFTRFANHSCQPNSQFQTFTWLGIQRIVIVSKGVQAGKEITVDYSGRYWQHLDKQCLCGESRCRYSRRG